MAQSRHTPDSGEGVNIAAALRLAKVCDPQPDRDVSQILLIASNPVGCNQFRRFFPSASAVNCPILFFFILCSLGEYPFILHPPFLSYPSLHPLFSPPEPHVLWTIACNGPHFLYFIIDHFDFFC
jgi:hypothetical protein